MAPPTTATAPGESGAIQEQASSPDQQLSDAIGRLERRMKFTFAEAQRHMHDESEDKDKKT